MKIPHQHFVRLAAAGGLAALLSAGAQATSLYTQTWSGAGTEGWEGNTIGSVVVHDAAIGNPAGSIATRFDSSLASFDIGFTSGSVAEIRGSFAGSPWQVPFDLQLNEGKFSDVWLRYRCKDFTFNGWRHALDGPFDRYGTWTNYSVVFDPNWTDVQATANGWLQEAGPVVSFSQTMGDVYNTEVRLALNGDTRAALAQLDNFVQTPVPELQTWALLLAGPLRVASRARRTLR